MSYETLLIGLVAATLFIEATGVYPGGVIAPAFLALYLDQPWRILTTVAVSLFSLLAYRLASRHLILFGRRRFTFILLAGAAGSLLLRLLLPADRFAAWQLQGVGVVIPGLLANTCERQGVVRTFAALGAVTAATHLVARLVAEL